MFKRQTTGSVVCASCGYLVGVRDETCYHCGRRNPGLWGFAPALRSLGNDLGFVPFMTATCIFLYVMSLIATGPGVLQGGGMMNFLSPALYWQVFFGAAGAVPVFEMNRWWTPLSASWLHGSALHILFNVYWIRSLAPGVAELYGPGRMVVIYVVAGVAGFLLTSFTGVIFGGLPILQGAPYTVGASASIFGLLGALVYYGKRGGSSMIGSQAWSMALFMFIFGFIMSGVDNYAHAGGFGGGYLTAMWLDPLKQERVNHLLWAVICLALSLLAIIASVIDMSIRFPVSMFR